MAQEKESLYDEFAGLEISITGRKVIKYSGQRGFTPPGIHPFGSPILHPTCTFISTTHSLKLERVVDDVLGSEVVDKGRRLTLLLLQNFLD